MVLCPGFGQGGGVTAFSNPIARRFFEDYAPGIDVRYGSEPVTEGDVLRFAREFDPQGIHVDPERAAAGPFSGLIASGWHTTAIMMRITATWFLNDTASLASPGVDELRWTRPVRPGDTLSARYEVLERRASRSKPDRGIVRTRVTVLNGRDETVLTLVMMNMLRRQPSIDQQP